MGCFSADGQKVKQQCIYRYERMPSILKSNFPKSMHLSCSKTGWMNSDLFIEFITEVFHPHVIRKHGPNVPVILYVDGHSSHLSLEVCLLCDSLFIVLVQLYPNTTFLIQPADVLCFKSLKSIWRKVIKDFRGNDIAKVVTKSAFGEFEKLIFPVNISNNCQWIQSQRNFSMES